MGEYAGDSVAKKVARVRLYKRTRDLLAASGHNPSTSTVLFIPGPECAEAGCLKYLLRVPPERCVGIDIDDKAGDALMEKLPGAVALTLDLRGGYAPAIAKSAMTLSVLDWVGEKKSSFSFIHLDLMGNLSADTELIYAQFGSLVDAGGVIAATYLRGREAGFSRHQLETTKQLYARMPLSTYSKRLLGSDYARSTMHFWALVHETSKRVVRQMARIAPPKVLKNLGITDPNNVSELQCLKIASHMWDDVGGYVPAAAYAYQGAVSPMGVIAAQWAPMQLRTKHWEDIYYGRKCFPPRFCRRLISSTISQNDMEELLVEVDELVKEGFSPAQVAEIMNTTVGTIAAWKAHRTMGTYEEK